MLSFFQQSLKKSNTSSHNPLITDGGATKTLFMTPKSPDDGFIVQTTFIHPDFKKLKEEGKPSVQDAVYHFHSDHEERFRLEKGAIILTIDGKTSRVTPKDGEIRIPAGSYHKFSPDLNCNEDVVLSTWALPDSKSMESFSRNLFSYLEDCHTTKKSPSFLQLLVFANYHQNLPAIPVIPKFAGQWMSKWILGFFGGKIIGENLFGYKNEYEEYLDNNLTKKNL